MEHIEQDSGVPTFSSVEEELKYLRERVKEKEAFPTKLSDPESLDAKVSQTIHEYAKQIGPSGNEQVNAERHLDNAEFEKVVGFIKTESHREKMRDFYSILLEKGVSGAVRFAREQGSPHFQDDFHRVLVGYVKSGAIIPGLDRERDLSKKLNVGVYQVTLPFASSEEGTGMNFHDVITAMERFYTGMIASISKGGYPLMSVEIAIENFSLDIVFYIAVPDDIKDIFMRQLFGVFPTASVKEDRGDYNIFNEYGVVAGGYAVPTDNFAYTIATSEQSESDPLKLLLNSFSKIDRDGEGASIQIILYPDQWNLLPKYKHAIGRMQQGVDVGSALDIPLGVGGEMRKAFTDFIRTQKKNPDTNNDESKISQRQSAIQFVQEKIAAPLVATNIRILASAATQERANQIYLSLESGFHQFNRPHANGIKFNKVEKTRLEKLIYQFTYRESNNDEAFILNYKELANIYHLPAAITQNESAQLKAVKAQVAPPPAELPKEGTLIGYNSYRGEKHDIRMGKLDRLRHLYVIGQTGTGKSSLLKNMVVEDIKAGNGVCYIDPHGSDVQDILSAVPPERIDDVIYFEPADPTRPFGLNMLEYDASHPEQKIFVVNEMLSIFKKLYAAGNPESMGPAFEQYFRNATMLVLEDPETGNTLLEISRVLADKNFRQLKLSRCKNPIVVQFWREIAEKTSGEAGLANMIPYITNKFDVFLSNDVMRPIIGQEQSSFNFRNIMDTKKILLVNLAKGKLGDINANLIGLILVGKILMSALSRVDSFGAKLPDFYLYIDEFQNITTDSISAILSEARKYGLSLNVAHQFIAQLDESISKAVFGNVGNMAVFRVGVEDAQFFESQFAPIFKAEDIMKIENYNAYLKILINGKPVPPFNIATFPPPIGTPEIVDKLKQLSSLKYGRDRKTVDDIILKKYLTTSQSASKTNATSPSPSNVSAPQAAAAMTFPAQGGADGGQKIITPTVSSVPNVSPAATPTIGKIEVGQIQQQSSSDGIPLPNNPPANTKLASVPAIDPVGKTAANAPFAQAFQSLGIPLGLQDQMPNSQLSTEKADRFGQNQVQ